MAVTRSLLRVLLVPALLAGAGASAAPTATEFQSLAETARMYDSPSQQGKPIFIIQRYTPVEVLVKVQDWVKVRDAGGSFAWVDKKSLSTKRTVMATQRAAVRLSPEPTAQVVFEVDKDVALELLDTNPPGWAKVGHKDGQSGFVKVNQVWGL